MNELDPLDGFQLQDIKTAPITPSQLGEMKKLAGSYESLFSKRARLYKEKGLTQKTLNEEDYKKLILEHYTFLKRPVIIFNDKIQLYLLALFSSRKVQELITKELVIMGMGCQSE